VKSQRNQCTTRIRSVLFKGINVIINVFTYIYNIGYKYIYFFCIKVFKLKIQVWILNFYYCTKSNDISAVVFSFWNVCLFATSSRDGPDIRLKSLKLNHAFIFNIHIIQIYIYLVCIAWFSVKSIEKFYDWSGQKSSWILISISGRIPDIRLTTFNTTYVRS